MRKLGMIGGMSWVSTALYYEAINKGVSRHRGGLSSAPLILDSHDFAPLAALQAAAEWDRVADLLIASARRLTAAGAQGLILCSNTMHRIYEPLSEAAGVEVIHIGEVTADKLAADGVKRAGLIGTRFTMNESFYRARLEARGIAVSTPPPAMAGEIDRIIFEELTRGEVLRNSQRKLKTCLTEMAQARNQAVVLGCTELVMLVDPGATAVPVYDTTAIHSQAAVDWILARA